MSYEIIKSIKIDEEKQEVWINCDSNNVSPRTFIPTRWARGESILKEQGKDALDLYILKAYEEGNFQRGSNKYVRALKVLRYFPEYRNFDWRGENEENRKSPAYEELLKKALKTQLPKDKFVISKILNVWGKSEGEKVYGKQSTRHIKWFRECDKARATIYRYLQEAESIKSCFTNSEDWLIEKIA